MRWRFTIIDRLNFESVLDSEPVGWDANVAMIKRDTEWHGVVFTNQGDEFEFDGNGMRLLKAEWDRYGFKADMKLKIEEDCGNGFVLYDIGRFDFGRYQFISGNRCYVKIAVEREDEMMIIRNRVNQKANLESINGFDGAILPHYSKLTDRINLPSKAIFIKDDAIAEEAIQEYFEGGLQGPHPDSDWNLTYGQLTFAMNTIASEIGSFSINTVEKLGPDYFGHRMDIISQNGDRPVLPDHDAPGMIVPGLRPLDTSAIVNLYPDSPNYGQISNPAPISFSINGSIEVLNCVLSTTAIYLLRLPNRPLSPNNGEALADYNILFRKVLFSNSSDAYAAGLQPGQTLNISASFSDPNFILKNGDRLYFFITTSEKKNSTYRATVNAGQKAFRLVINQDSFFKITNLSHTKSTTSKIYLLNEAISRVSEIITDGKVRAYSDYFGRTDSEPYNHPVDGCGSLAGITNGIRIRNQENRTGNTDIFALSLQDLWEGISPIHNIGIGLEKDPNRPGYNRLRVEKWEHFYQNDVIISCIGVETITRKAIHTQAYSTFQIGYQKWEAEEYTGLDEFLTNRSYRSTLSLIKSDLIKLSKFIASGYALEITRRKGKEDSKDWRYDKDTFIICLKRGGLGEQHEEDSVNFGSLTSFVIIEDPIDFFAVGRIIAITGTNFNNKTVTITAVTPIGGGSYIIGTDTSFTAEIATNVTFTDATPTDFSVELGNILYPSNIIDPDTIYNFRISPARNAIRWMNRIFQSYKHVEVSDKFIFSDGTGNYFASGLMKDTTCRQEAIPVQENTDLSQALVADLSTIMPLMDTERVVFDFAMSSIEYQAVRQNPYGLIYFENDTDSGYGWIDTIMHNSERGSATFTLIPKRQ